MMPLKTTTRPGQLVHRSRICSRRMSACPQCCAAHAALQLQRPHRAVTATVDHGVERLLAHGAARHLAPLPMGLFDACDGVRTAKGEGTVGCARDADVFEGPATAGLVEPDALDVGDVLEQAEQTWSSRAPGASAPPRRSTRPGCRAATPGTRRSTRRGGLAGPSSRLRIRPPGRAWEPVARRRRRNRPGVTSGSRWTAARAGRATPRRRSR